jgi:chemotaxis protein methyltransferase CheR
MNFDVIFCCNVLIYFDSRSKVQVVSNLFDSLRRGGFLFIGYAESLHGISTAFKLVNFPKTVAYKKE